MPRVGLIRGDGVGSEIADAAIEVLDAVGIPIDWEEHPAGYAAYEQHGHTAPPSTIDAIRDLGSALKGPFYTPSGGRVRSANHYLRPALDLFAAVRPVRRASHGIDLVVVRENLEDLYPAIEWWAAPGVAQAVKVATEPGCERIARMAFALAARRDRKKVTIVHKANNLKLTEGLFLDTALAVARDHPDVEVSDLIADTACSSVVLEPSTFGVVLANNTFGDLLSNIAAAVAGSLGVVPSGNYGPEVMVAEASHGSVDELAGNGRVNPIAMIRAGAMLADHLGFGPAASAIDRATDQSIDEGFTTEDLGGGASTVEVTQDVARRAKELLREHG